MARSTERITLRNNNLRVRFRYHRKKNPKWTIIAVIEQTADEFYLSPSTVTGILKQFDEKVPCVDTVAKYTTQLMLF